VYDAIIRTNSIFIHTTGSVGSNFQPMELFPQSALKVKRSSNCGTRLPRLHKPTHYFNKTKNDKFPNHIVDNSPRIFRQAIVLTIKISLIHIEEKNLISLSHNLSVPRRRLMRCCIVSLNMSPIYTMRR